MLAGVFVSDVPSITTSQTNVTVVVGRDAYLTCNVENLQNYMVYIALLYLYIPIEHSSTISRFMTASK